MFENFKFILNHGQEAEPKGEFPLDVSLSLALADLKAQFMDTETGEILYGKMKDSEAFLRYEGLTRGLALFPLESLRDRAQRLAFWINVYNAAVIHGVVSLGVKRSVREVRLFFKRVAYRIGGYVFSLHEMEHGILRGNSRAPYGILRPFRKRDPRIAFCVEPLDPRIHFAMVCGARSCPPVGFYEAQRVDFQLDLATASFINGPGVKFLPESGVLELSQIFRWYKWDFGGMSGIMDLLLKYLDPGQAREAIARHRTSLPVRFQHYDWDLN